MSDLPANIWIEGNIGSGKSSLLALIAQRLSYPVFPEPVSDWTHFQSWRSGRKINFLDMFYKKSDFVFQFQTFVLVSMFNRLQSASHFSDLNIFERSGGSSVQVFAKAALSENRLTEDEMEILYYLFDTLYASRFEVDEDNGQSRIIYLDCPPSICLERTKKRGREEEANVSLSYFELINKHYREWLTKVSIPVYIIDASESIEKIYSDFCQYLPVPDLYKY
ncbi:MAG: deoxynucleoside kinase [Candidatus Omnitrophica bacterium]|nr:deoxynucleoside kinase [Candidatus Omnitrophota bacterium]